MTGQRYEELGGAPQGQQRSMLDRNEPSCPLCGLVEHVERNRQPGTSTDLPWFCGHCSTLFAGSDEEWRRMAPKRRERLTVYAALRTEAAQLRGQPEPPTAVPSLADEHDAEADDGRPFYPRCMECGAEVPDLVDAVCGDCQQPDDPPVVDVPAGGHL